MGSQHLPTLGDDLLAEAREAPSGRAARSLHGGSNHRLRHTVTALCRDRGLNEHNSPGEATLQVLTGHVRLLWGQDTWDGHAGDIVPIPRERHSLEAIEDSVIMLTVVVVDI